MGLVAVRVALVALIAALASGCGQSGSGDDADGGTASPDATAADAAAACETPEDCDDLNSCTADSCEDRLCVHVPTREQEPCNDRLFCTDVDLCSDGECVGADRDCTYLNDLCNTGVCDEDAEECIAEPVANQTSCEDGLFCTVDDECIDGVCIGGPALDCSAVEDQCNDSECSETLASCVPVPLDVGDCEDGKTCTEGDTCVAGECVGGAPPSCDDLDDCTDDSCDTVLDQCVNAPVAPIPNAEGPTGDATCSDGEDNDCDGAEDLADTDCIDCASDPDCDDGRACTDDWCNGVVCENDPLTGTDCDAELYCTVGDLCSNGLCVPGTPADCGDGDSCTVDGCDEVGDTCLNPPRTIDPASAVRASGNGSGAPSVCLVAGTGARTLLWAELVDTAGAPFEGATVTIGGLAATEHGATSGVYYIELQASGAPSSEALPVVATACGDTVTLDAAVTVLNTEPNATDGGTGGCAPAGGNLRVRVVDEDGSGIVGAQVLVGLSEGAPFEHSAAARFGGASSPSTNVAVTTGADGVVEFYDYGSTLAAPFTVTAGADNRAYFTLTDVNASDVVLPLPELHPAPVPTTTYDLGTATANVTGCNDLDLALVLPILPLDYFSRFDVKSVFSEYRCWDSGNGSFGTVALPGNLWVPAQSLGFLCLIPGAIDEANWALELPNTAATGQNENMMFGHVRVPLSAVQAAVDGGALEDLLASTTFHGIGFLLDEDVPTPPTAGRSAAVDSDYRDSSNDDIAFTVTYVNRPDETDVVGFAAGDYSGGNGTGSLFVLGHEIHEYDVAGSSVAIPTSDLEGAGAPAGIRRLGTISAMYLDDTAHPGIPANRLDGVSTVLVRQSAGGGEPFGATGGSATVSDMLDIVGASSSGPSEFRWESAIRNGNVPMYSRHELSVRTRRFRVLSCQAENDIREEHSVQWIVLRPFGAACTGQECFTLPTLPASFPRQGDGVQKKSGFEAYVGSGAACSGPGECESGEVCVDPDGAGPVADICMAGAGSESDPYYTQDYRWGLHVYDLGLAPGGWSFDAFDLANHPLHVTHESWNQQGFQ